MRRPSEDGARRARSRRGSWDAIDKVAGAQGQLFALWFLLSACGGRGYFCQECDTNPHLPETIVYSSATWGHTTFHSNCGPATGVQLSLMLGPVGGTSY